MQLGRLQFAYGDKAYYVHLVRDREKVAKSFERLIDSPVSNVRAFQRGVLGLRRVDRNDLLAICLDYVDTVKANIDTYLRDKRSIVIDIDHPQPEFDKFLVEIAAEGDLDAARAELAIHHNLKLNQSYLRRRYRWLKWFADR